MKIQAAALLSVAALAAACAPADANLSPTPSASASMPAEVMPDELPAVVFDRVETKGMITVGDRVAFDLPEPAAWTATVDTAGLLELDAATLTGTAVAPGDVVVTLTNGGESVVFTISIR
jgi:hypothetical protein